MKRKKKQNNFEDIRQIVRQDSPSLTDAQIAIAWDKIPVPIRIQCDSSDAAALVVELATEHALREIAEAKLKALHPTATLVDDALNRWAAFREDVARRFAVWLEHRHAARIERKRRLLLAGAILWTGKLPGGEA